MLTSGTVSVCNTVNLRSLLIEHLEDHENGVFNSSVQFEEISKLKEENMEFRRIRAKLLKQLAAIESVIQEGKNT